MKMAGNGSGKAFWALIPGADSYDGSWRQVVLLPANVRVRPVHGSCKSRNLLIIMPGAIDGQGW